MGRGLSDLQKGIVAYAQANPDKHFTTGDIKRELGTIRLDDSVISRACRRLCNRGILFSYACRGMGKSAGCVRYALEAGHAERMSIEQLRGTLNRFDQ
jgi:hypothetical protein